jgi:hypothetical protein
MRILLWFGAAGALALWSVLAWIGHGLVPAAVALTVAAPAWVGVDPSAAALVAETIEPLVPFAEGAIVLLWAIGALAILAAPLVIGRIARRSRHAADGAAGFALAWLERRRMRRAGAIGPAPHRRVDRRAGPTRW